MFLQRMGVTVWLLSVLMGCGSGPSSAPPIPNPVPPVISSPFPSATPIDILTPTLPPVPIVNELSTEWTWLYDEGAGASMMGFPFYIVTPEGEWTRFADQVLGFAAREHQPPLLLLANVQHDLPLRLLDMTTHTSVPLQLRRGQHHDYWNNALSPDGTQLAFHGGLSLQSELHKEGIYVVDLQSGEVTLFFHYPAIPDSDVDSHRVLAWDEAGIYYKTATIYPEQSATWLAMWEADTNPPYSEADGTLSVIPVEGGVPPIPRALPYSETHPAAIYDPMILYQP